MMPDFFAMDTVKITCGKWQEGIGLLAKDVVVEVDDSQQPVSICLGSLIGPRAIVKEFLDQLAGDPVPLTITSTQADGRVFADCIPVRGHYPTESVVVGDMHLFGEMCIDFTPTPRCQGCGAGHSNLYTVQVEPLNPAVEWRKARICPACVERLDADMWVAEWHWEAIGPVVPFAELPAKSAPPDVAPARPPFVLTVPADLYVELPARARKTLADVARMAQQRLLAGKHTAAPPPAGGPVETGRGKKWTPNGSAAEIRDMARKRGWDDRQLLQVVLDAIDSLELPDVGDFILEAIAANTSVPGPAK
jgi:hypothetical protein